MASAQPGHDMVTTLFIELTGIAVLAVFAGMSDDIGKVMLIIMWGIFLGWCLLHTAQLGNMVKAL